jgi:hypothetical protein
MANNNEGYYPKRVMVKRGGQLQVQGIAYSVAYSASWACVNIKPPKNTKGRGIVIRPHAKQQYQ